MTNLPVSDNISRFYGSLDRWPVEPDGINFTQSQVLAVCEHIAITGDCLWHAQHVVLWHNKPCNCAGCKAL